MSAPKERKSLAFRENDYKFLKICSIGYNNHTNNTTSDFFCVNQWNALYFIRNGNGSVLIRGKSHAVKHGDMFFITPNEPWNIHFDENDAWEYYWIAFNADYANEIREILGFGDGEYARAAKFPQRVEWIFDSLLEAKSATAEVYFNALSALMQILAAEFSKSGTDVSTVRHKELAENAKQIIDINFKNPDFSVAHAAEMLYLSHGQMSRVFKEVIGISPVTYLIDIRLNYAAEILREGNISVKELCACAGFSDTSHFMKRFKKKFGTTVMQYRKLHTHQ